MVTRYLVITSCSEHEDTPGHIASPGFYSNGKELLSYLKIIRGTEQATYTIGFVRYYPIPIKELKEWFDILPPYVDTLIINPQYVENYSKEELILLGKSLKYIKIIKQSDESLKYIKIFKQSDETVSNPKLNYLIENMGNEVDKGLIEEVLLKYVPCSAIVSHVVAPFIFSEKDTISAAAKKTAKNNNIKLKEYNSFKLQCLCALALISTSVLIAGIIATSGLALVTAGSAGLAVALIYGIFNRKEIIEVLSVDKPPIKPS